VADDGVKDGGVKDNGETMGGVPDGFERLWTPHRMAYVKDASVRAGLTPGSGCPFCLEGDADDRTKLIVGRGETCFAVLNLFPYNPGHLMICPYRHIAWYTDMTEEERNEMAAMTQKAMRILKAVSGTNGFNIGINQGMVGGAGIAEHLHQHVVPRWIGDSNFLPIIAKTKAVPQLLDDTWQRISEAWAKEN
jgi:ATP adenylyltransferase